MTNIQEQSKKGGRPPTGRVRKLSKSVTVKFSKPSYEALRLRARKANRKLAEYIRESALNGEVVSGHNAETVAIAKNLIGMANNLNQLTKLSHQRGFHETHVYVVDLLRRLKAILGEYRQASSKPKPSGMNRKRIPHDRKAKERRIIWWLHPLCDRQGRGENSCFRWCFARHECRDNAKF